MKGEHKREIKLKSRFHACVLCLLVVVICFSVFDGICQLLMHLGIEQRLADSGGRFVVSVCIIIVYRYLYSIRSFGLGYKNFFYGMVTGGFLFFIILANAVAAVIEIQEYIITLPPAALIFVVVLEQFLIGVFEEFLFRGFMLNVLLKGGERNGYREKMQAVLFSSILFGLVHLINLTDTPALVLSTISQVIYATFIGFYLGVLYLRSGNIWVVVIYHMLIDLISGLSGIFVSIPDGSVMDVDISLIEMLQDGLSNSIFLFAAMFLARKLKDTVKGKKENGVESVS